jgi:NADPH:quinone reductase-like Zn-dependent oxidoreductase
VLWLAVPSGRSWGAMLLGPVLSIGGGITVRSLRAQPSQHDLAFVSGLLESGEVVPVVDRCYPLRELPEALRYRASGHARGKIVITMEHTSE